MPAPTVIGFAHCREEKILFGLHLNGCLIDSNRQKWAIFCHSKGSESDDLMNFRLLKVQKFMKMKFQNL